MINKDRAKRLSKFLSLVLRHQPEKIGLTLDENGWADVNSLIMLMNKNKQPINKEILDFIVDNNDKKRFAFNADKTKIRANQGHSIQVDLAYEKKSAEEIPNELYHGTSEKYAQQILTEGGITKQQRHHVHLSADIATASAVGKRHGKLAIFSVNTKAMISQGHDFYQSANGVWLTDEVPANYLTLMEK